MAVETTVGGSGTEADVANATIDSDGHVQEQLTLPPEIMTEVMERIGGIDMEALTALMAAPENDPFPMESSGPPTLQTIAGGGTRSPASSTWTPTASTLRCCIRRHQGSSGCRMREVMHTMAHEYNRWLHEYCSEDRRGSSASGSSPLQDPGLAVKEMERCVSDLDFKAVMIRPAPYIETRS